MPNTMNQTTQSPSTRPSKPSTHGTSSRPKGKSKYAQKSRGKSSKPVTVKSGPVNTYTSVCCSAPSTKPACTRVDKKKALEQGLGSWRCSACHKSCKVTVSKAKAPESLTQTGWKPSDQVLPSDIVIAPVNEVTLALDAVYILGLILKEVLGI